MDVNTFITKLETELGCEGMGYEKCLESVIHIKEENKKNDLLKMVVGFCYTPDNDDYDLILEMLKNKTDDKKLIKSVFDEWHDEAHYYDIEKDEIIEYGYESDDE